MTTIQSMETISNNHSLTQNDKRRRIVGLDLFKIFCSIIITIRHFIRYSSLIGAFPETSFNKILAVFFNALAPIGINGFILISGYFLVKSKFKWKRIFSIWGETIFFSLIFFLLGFAFHLVEFRPVYVLFAITPIISRHYWFPVAYLVLCLIAPYLNQLVKAINKKEYIILLVGGAVLFSAWTTIVYYSEGALTGGHTGILWMMYLYLIGGFFATYNIESKKSCLLSIIVGVSCLGVLIIYQILAAHIAILKNFPLLADDSIFALLLSVGMFLLFKGINVKSKKVEKVIATISVCSFGVYLIQENCMIRNWLWFEVVRANTMLDKWYLYPVMSSVAVILFVLAFIFNRVYKAIFNSIMKLIERSKSGKTN